MSVHDVVQVAPGSIPITTSGKVRRAACVQLYKDDGFQRVDVRERSAVTSGTGTVEVWPTTGTTTAPITRG